MLVLQGILLLTICAVAQVNAQSYVMPPADDKLHIYALPVGQGDATVIQCPAGTGGLTIVDFGSSARQNKHTGITYMTDAEIKRFLDGNVINYVFLTHGDEDHYNLLSSLNLQADSADLARVVIGCSEAEYGDITQWLKDVGEQSKLESFPGDCTTNCNFGVPICTGKEGQGEVVMRVMGANLDIYSAKVCTNGDSLVTRLEYGDFKLLLPGDLEDNGDLKYDSDGNIKSNNDNLNGKPGLLKRLIEEWEDSDLEDDGGIQADFYKLAHHGSYSNANKEFFLNAIGVRYAFSSSMIPPGKYNHPNCKLYDLLKKIPTIEIVEGSMQQTQYSCGITEQGVRRCVNKEANDKGVYTTAVCDTNNIFHNYIIKIDTDGSTNSIGPVELRLTPSITECTCYPEPMPGEDDDSHMELEEHKSSHWEF